MAKSFKLPDLGEGIHEGEVIAVTVAVGQAVKEGEVILEVETDKAAVEIPSPYTGRVAEIRVKPGDVVNVGAVLITFDIGEADETPAAAPTSGKAQSTEAAEAHRRAAAIPAERSKRPVPAAPATRRLARELGVELSGVTPTGTAGLVTADDVRKAAAAVGEAAETASVGDDVVDSPTAKPVPAEVLQAGPAPSAPAVPRLPDFGKWGEIERVPFRSIRRKTAQQMSLAWSQIPHVSSQEEVDVTRLEAFRQNHKDQIVKMGGRLTITVFALKAVATALKTYPNFNASLDTANGHIIRKKYFHVGVAVSTDNGLIVPVIRDVDRKSIKELSVELHELVQRTRARKAGVEEMQGGSFTITNAGAMGGGFFTPIINYPQVAILGMGQARLKPVVAPGDSGENNIRVRLILPLVLCIDHRVLDGADAIAFLQLMKSALEDPDELLMSMV